jgi:hypothetical protein
VSIVYDDIAAPRPSLSAPPGFKLLASAETGARTHLIPQAANPMHARPLCGCRVRHRIAYNTYVSCWNQPCLECWQKALSAGL